MVQPIGFTFLKLGGGLGSWVGALRFSGSTFGGLGGSSSINSVSHVDSANGDGRGSSGGARGGHGAKSVVYGFEGGPDVRGGGALGTCGTGGLVSMAIWPVTCRRGEAAGGARVTPCRGSPGGAGGAGNLGRPAA
jgi:hypothetical protein